MSDRYADAVRARRTELRDQLGALGGGYRAELRTALALSRVRAAAAAGTALAGLSDAAAAHLERADRTQRRRFAQRLADAVHDTTDELYDNWAATLQPALRRLAGSRSLPVQPTLPAARRPELPEPTAGPRRLRPAAVGVLHGAALWRLAILSLAVLPLSGLPVLGGPALLPAALGVGVALVAATVRAGWIHAERDRLRQHAERVLAAAAVALEADLGRRTLELEATATAMLDAAVRDRRRVVEAELAGLAATGAR